MTAPTWGFTPRGPRWAISSACVIADNASSGAFVTTGVTLPPDALDLATEAVLMELSLIHI